jgi:polysaccharide pyruvyl transferase WcaK-like protein
MRILLRGSYDSFNLGDDLTFIALVRFLRREFGVAQDALEVYARRRLGSLERLVGRDGFCWTEGREIDDLVRARWPTAASRAPRVVRRLLLLLTVAALFVHICIFRILRKCIAFGDFIPFFAGLDVIHYKGGGYVAGRWRNRLVHEVLTLRAAKMSNPRLKIVGTGLGLGPFDDRRSSLVARAFLSKFDTLFVRDRQSLDIAKSLNPRLDVRCLADDVLLFAPMIESMDHRGGGGGKAVAAINLKDFPDHDYGVIADKVDELLATLQARGLRVEFFSFSHSPGPCDSRALESLPLRHRDIIQAVHNPYEEGLDIFLANLGKARLGFGFAYHFIVVLGMMDVPAVAAYAGGYYQQKMRSAAEFLDLPLVLSADDLMGLDVRTVVDQVLRTDVHQGARIKSLHLEMVREYAAMYGWLVQSAAGTIRADHRCPVG